MINERILFGYPIEFQDVCLIYPPVNKDIIAIGYNNFWRLYSLLTTSYEDLYDLCRDKTKKLSKKLDIKDVPMPWDNLWNMIQDKETESLIRVALTFFLKSKIYFLPETKEIIVGPIEEHRAINAHNFFDFQNAIRSCIGMKEVKPPDLKMHPKLREMKAKARERDRVKAKQNEGNFSYSTLLLCTCVMDIGINIDSILEKTYAMTFTLYKFGNRKEKYNIDIKSIIAGADPKKVKLEQWNTDIVDEN